MGISLMKCSGVTEPGSQPPPPPNPNPYRFQIQQAFVWNKHILVRVKYPDCTTFEGEKLMLFLNTTLEQITKARFLDPHFSNGPGLHPAARFEPTDRGLDMAFELLRSIE